MVIEVLFPEICNLYGDLANIKYLKESLPEATIIETSLKEEPYFVNNKVDLIYMGTTTEEGIVLSLKALTKYKSILGRLIEDGQFFLLTGNAQDIFGQYIESDMDTFFSNDNPRRVECLGFLNSYAKYRMLNRHNSFFIGKPFGEDFEVVGFKSIFGHTYTINEKNSRDTDCAEGAEGTGGHDADCAEGWFEVVRGVGRNPETLIEGFKLNNLYATSLIGPLLLLNPLLTNWVIKKLGVASEPKYYGAAMDAYRQRLAEMKNEHFDPNY